MADFYTSWIDEQTAAVESGMRDLGRKGAFTAAVYVVRSQGAMPGRLVVSQEQVAGACDVLRFPAQGSNVMAVPYSHLRSLLWNACRSMPILPTA